ncbi:MAG: IscS subfamily cysteine desulfurase [Gammaproteobacteria bacterium]|nr:IscS subfamily cysteine desulfurase [Gammaproteobacteria bacterium]MYJ76398.1 IscS subfamily cysteine desulfurase [Gammaproteobacteria bacterium]
MSEPAATAASPRAVYLDYSATTPVDPRVAEKMSGCLLADGEFGNPASTTHEYGWDAAELVEEARANVAALINADPRAIVWTSGATESDNLALKGLAEVAEGGHLVTTSYEHKAVLDTAKYLEGNGVEVTYLDPGPDGLVDPALVAAALRDDTFLVSVMHANNEVGTVNDIAAIGRLCRERGIPFHTDAAQSAGKLPLDVERDCLDLVSISGHKIYGPKGIGVLYVRHDPPLAIAPQIHGGGHERGMRSGTLATHQIVGMGEACRLARLATEAESGRIAELRSRLWSHIKQIPGTRLNGSAGQRLPGTLNIAFSGVDGETLLMALDDVAVSSGSACTSATVEPSYVLRAMNISDELAASSLRLTVGRFTTADEVDFAGRRLAEIVGGLRDRTGA